MIFKYVAYSTDKKLVEGKIDVASESLAEVALYHAGFENFISLKEMAAQTSAEKLLPSLFGVKQKEVIDASNQLATLIQSGITISAALKLLEGQATKKALKQVLHKLIEEIQEGNSLSQALMLFPQVFTTTYCQIIKASEQARQTINQWVSDQTEARIKDLLPQGSINNATRMVLTNAIYFNAAWASQFEKSNTKDGQFHPLTGNDVTVPMMYQMKSFRYGEGTN